MPCNFLGVFLIYLSVLSFCVDKQSCVLRLMRSNGIAVVPLLSVL